MGGRGSLFTTLGDSLRTLVYQQDAYGGAPRQNPEVAVYPRSSIKRAGKGVGPLFLVSGEQVFSGPVLRDVARQVTQMILRSHKKLQDTPSGPHTPWSNAREGIG